MDNNTYIDQLELDILQCTQIVYHSFIAHRIVT